MKKEKQIYLSGLESRLIVRENKLRFLIYGFVNLLDN